MSATPRNVEQYLDALRAALRGADPALVQDALYDAEEHLRAALAQAPGGDSESDVLARIVSSYGAPEEVAEAYRENEAKVREALRTPQPAPRRTALGRFFGVYLDPRAYLSLLYFTLALVTGIAYFTFTMVGLSMSAGFAILIIGIPIFLLFLGATRGVALAEGRLVEAMLGTRMPRRPVYRDRAAPWYTRIVDMLKDRRTWTTLIYPLMMLPLGIFYFTFVVVGITVSVMLAIAPIAALLYHFGLLQIGGDLHIEYPHPALLPLISILGIVLLTITLQLARGLGNLHGLLAKNLLVSTSRTD